MFAFRIREKEACLHFMDLSALIWTLIFITDLFEVVLRSNAFKNQLIIIQNFWHLRYLPSGICALGSSNSPPSSRFFLLRLYYCRHKSLDPLPP